MLSVLELFKSKLYHSVAASVLINITRVLVYLHARKAPSADCLDEVFNAIVWRRHVVRGRVLEVAAGVDNEGQ